MKTRSVVLAVSLVLAAGAFPPTLAFAGPHPHHGTAVVVGPTVPRPFFGRPFVRPRFVPRFVLFGVVAAPVVVYALPPVLYAAPPVVYTPPPVAYYAPPAVAPPSLSQVIEYPHGRYELRGDGITTPYQWVWIPNPPPPPPPAAPPPEPSTQQAPPASRSDVYSWTDERGVTTWTDQRDKIPVR